MVWKHFCSKCCFDLDVGVRRSFAAGLFVCSRKCPQERKLAKTEFRSEGNTWMGSSTALAPTTEKCAPGIYKRMSLESGTIYGTQRPSITFRKLNTGDTARSRASTSLSQGNMSCWEPSNRQNTIAPVAQRAAGVAVTVSHTTAMWNPSD